MAVGKDKAEKAQKEANRFTKVMMQNRHQWETADLEAAGLNRILGMTGSGPPIGGSPAPFAPSSAQDVASLGAGGKMGTEGTKDALAMRNYLRRVKFDAKTAESTAAMAKTGEATAQHTRDSARENIALVQQQAATSAALENKLSGETAIIHAKTPRVQTQELMWNKILGTMRSTGQSLSDFWSRVTDPKTEKRHREYERKYMAPSYNQSAAPH